MNLCVKTCNFASSIQCRFGSQFSFLLRPFHRPGVDIPQPAAVPPIGCRITPSSWIIWPLLPAHTERNSASVPSTNHRHLAQYGRDGTHKEAGSGCQLVEPARLSLAHPAVSLWICQGLQRKPMQRPYVSSSSGVSGDIQREGCNTWPLASNQCSSGSASTTAGSAWSQQEQLDTLHIITYFYIQLHTITFTLFLLQGFTCFTQYYL